MHTLFFNSVMVPLNIKAWFVMSVEFKQPGNKAIEKRILKYNVDAQSFLTTIPPFACY